MLPKYLIEKQPEGVLDLVEGDLPLQVIPSQGPGDYLVYALSDDVANVTTTGRPVIITQPALSGSGEIGTVVTATPGAWAGADSVSAVWLRDGVVIPGATGTSYMPVPADDQTVLSYRETATNVSGPEEADSAGITVLYAPPQVIGTPDMEIFDQDPGQTATFETALFFSGDNLTFTGNGAAGTSVDPGTGVVTVPLDLTNSGIDVEITATNSGGAEVITVQLVIETDAPQQSVDGILGLATFTFNTDAQVEVTITGEPLVLMDGAVDVVSISPFGTTEATASYQVVPAGGVKQSWIDAGVRVLHGTMIDPFWDKTHNINSVAWEVGWDNYVVRYYQDNYNAALNVDPGATGNPIPTQAAAAKTAGLIASGSTEFEHCMPIWKAISIVGDPTLYDGAQNNQATNAVPVGIASWEILSCVSSLPPDNTYFRPPQKGWDGNWSTWFNDNDFDYTRLYDCGYSADGFFPLLADVQGPIHTLEPVFASSLNQRIRGAVAADMHYGYSRSFGKRTGTRLQILFGAEAQATKIEIARKYIQKGLDYVYTDAYRPFGFYNPGPIGMIALVLFLLKDGAKKTAFEALILKNPIVQKTFGREVQRYNYVTTEMTQITEPDTQGEDGRDRNYIWPSEYANINFPFWSEVKVAPIADGTASEYEDCYYNIVSTYNRIGWGEIGNTMIAIHCMANVDSTIWTKLGLEATRDYADKLYWYAYEGRVDNNFSFGGTGGKGPEYGTVDLVNTMTQEYFDLWQGLILDAGSFNHTPWTGIPDPPTPPQVFYNDVDGDIDIIMAPLVGHNGNPLTNRDLRWNINDGPWTVVPDVTTAAEGTLSFTPTGAVSGDRIRVQIRNTNSMGVSAWSSNLSARFVYALEYSEDTTRASVVIP